MSKGMNSLAAGAAVVLAAGTAVYFFSGKKRRTMKKLKRSARKSNEGHGRPGRQCVLHDEITPENPPKRLSGGFCFFRRRGGIFLVCINGIPTAVFSGNT